MRRNYTEENKGGFLASFIGGSVILRALDRFAAYIYRLVKTGFFGFLFTGYRGDSRSELCERLSATRVFTALGNFRRYVCRNIESSVFVHLAQYLVTVLLGCRLKVYGAFLTSFGAYTAIIAVIMELLVGGAAAGEDLLYNTNVIVSGIMIAAGFPLVLSKKSLSEALCATYTGSFIRRITGFTEEDLYAQTGGGHMSVAFLLGMIFGALTYKISPLLIVFGIAAIVCAYLVLVRPEIGVLALFFLMPILPTMALAGIVMYTFLCYLIKLIRQKRVLKLEPVDIAVAAFAFMTLSGGVISVSSSSLKPALMFVCFLAAYFLVVGLIRSGEWLTRCSVACVSSASLISAYGLITYFTGTAKMAEAWLDTEMFGAIKGRAIATLENPNMLGEYLVLIIPIAAGIILRRYGGMRKLSAMFCLGVMGLCLLCTWSRGAWLALILAMVLFLFMWHRRAVFLVIAGIVSVPFLPMILPASIVSRFTSIGNMGDSSTSYRVYIWRAAINMIEDNFLSGIGIGEGAWYNIYPGYAYLGIEAAPHSHNLYLQIMLELGVVGLAVFVVFLFLLYQSGFTFFAKLSDDSIAVPENLTVSDVPLSPDPNKNMRRSKSDLRISAAAPLCGVFAVLVQGMTDYAWYNYRVYLMFWLICGLASAYIRTGNSLLDENDRGGSSVEYSIDLKKR